MGTLQIGKNGITSNFMNTIETMFKNHHMIKISVLKSARGEGKEAKEEVKKYAYQILKKIDKNYTTKIIGFVIILQKWRRAMRE